MSGDWFRDLADNDAAIYAERRPPSRRRTSMRTSASSSPKSGNIISPQIACLAAVVLAISFATLLYTSLLLSPALLRAVLKDVMCDSMRNLAATSDDQRNHISATRNVSHILQVAKDGSPQPNSKLHEKITILLGVFTIAANSERRNLLRLAYGVQQTSQFVEVTVKFVVGKPRSGEVSSTMMGLESVHHSDILVLDCEENMNHGKSFTFFNTVATMGTHYDYVMKADDDSYIRLENLASSLSSQPRNDLYYGYVLPCENDDAYAWYMAGMGYVISWDLVQWVHDSPIPGNNSEGTEDELMGKWLNAGKKAKNRVSKKPLFYDHPEFGGKCAHELIPETILVHQVKTPERWHQVLQFFEGGRV